MHRDATRRWFTGSVERFATCPITQGSLVRTWLRAGGSAESAQQSLSVLLRNPRHHFWPDVFGYDEVPLDGIVGHRQVTDAYLAQLARVREGRLATLDRGLVALHSDVATLVPTG